MNDLFLLLFDSYRDILKNKITFNEINILILLYNMNISKVELNDIYKIYMLGKHNLNVYYNKNQLYDFFKLSNYEIYKLHYNTNIFGYIIFEKKYKYQKIHIMSLAIDLKIRNKGLGTALINYVKKIYPKVKITLNVQTSNLNALNFYYKNNFKAIIFKNNYYTDGIRDAIEMIYIPTN